MRISDWSSDVCSSDLLRGCGLSTRPGSGQSSRRSTQENTKGRDCTRRAATRPLRGGARGTQLDAALATIGRLALVDLEASGGHDQLAEHLESVVASIVIGTAHVDQVTHRLEEPHNVVTEREAGAEGKGGVVAEGV